MSIDLLVVGAVIVGAFAGWRRGFIMPLVAVGTGLVGLYALYAGPGADVVPSGAAGIGAGVLVVGLAASLIGRIGGMLISLIHRVGFLQRLDQTAGIPLGAVLALVPVYAALVAVVSFDGIIAPLHGKATVDQAAVAAVRAAVAANPQFGVMLDPGTLDQMAQQVAKSAIPADQIATIDSGLSYYEKDVRPQLLQSTLVPLILGIGEKVPYLGHHVDLPTK